MTGVTTKEGSVMDVHLSRLAACAPGAGVLLPGLAALTANQDDKTGEQWS